MPETSQPAGQGLPGDGMAKLAAGGGAADGSGGVADNCGGGGGGGGGAVNVLGAATCRTPRTELASRAWISSSAIAQASKPARSVVGRIRMERRLVMTRVIRVTSLEPVTETAKRDNDTTLI